MQINLLNEMVKTLQISYSLGIKNHPHLSKLQDLSSRLIGLI